MAVTLQQIADAAGVSRGTVDRALNNRGRIRPEVAERIREIAEQMGYKPNTGGRALALLKHRRTIGVIEQFAETPFIIEVDEGIRAAQDEIDRFGCEVKICRIDGIDADKVANTMWEMREAGVNGIALVATEDPRIRKEIELCVQAEIPVVTFNSDLVGSARMAYVGQDAYNCGRTAAGLMRDMLSEGGKIAILTGDYDSSIQNERIRGFRDVIETQSEEARRQGCVSTAGEEKRIGTAGEEKRVSTAGEGKRVSTAGEEKRVSAAGEEKRVSTVGEEKCVGAAGEEGSSGVLCEIVSVRETGETVSGLKQQAEELLDQEPDIAGIYMNAQGKNELCEILKARGLDRSVRLIVNDLVACNRSYIEDGTINYIIDEDAVVQGTEAVMTLFRLLYDGKEPERETNHTEIKIISKYNLA